MTDIELKRLVLLSESKEWSTTGFDEWPVSFNFGSAEAQREVPLLGAKRQVGDESEASHRKYSLINPLLAKLIYLFKTYSI